MVSAFTTPILSVAADAVRDLDGREALSGLWAVFTKCKGSLQNGPRLENIAWRLWHQKMKGSNREPRYICEDHTSLEKDVYHEKSTYQSPTPSEILNLPPPYPELPSAPTVASSLPAGGLTPSLKPYPAPSAFTFASPPPLPTPTTPLHTRRLFSTSNRRSSFVGGSPRSVGKIICDLVPTLSPASGSNSSSSTNSSSSGLLLGASLVRKSLSLPRSIISEPHPPTMKMSTIAPFDGSHPSSISLSEVKTSLDANTVSCLPTILQPLTPTLPTAPQPSHMMNNLHTQPPRLVVVHPTPNPTPHPTPPTTPLITGVVPLAGHRAVFLSPPSMNGIPRQQAYTLLEEDFPSALNLPGLSGFSILDHEGAQSGAEFVGEPKVFDRLMVTNQEITEAASSAMCDHTLRPANILMDSSTATTTASLAALLAGQGMAPAYTSDEIQRSPTKRESSRKPRKQHSQSKSGSSIASKTSEVSHTTSRTSASNRSSISGITATSTAFSSDMDPYTLNGQGLEKLVAGFADVNSGQLRSDMGGLDSATVAALKRLGSLSTIHSSSTLGRREDALHSLEGKEMNMQMVLVSDDEFNDEDDEPPTPLSPVRPHQSSAAAKKLKRNSAPPKLTSTALALSPTSTAQGNRSPSIARSSSTVSSKRKARTVTSAAISRQSSNGRSSSQGRSTGELEDGNGISCQHSNNLADLANLGIPGMTIVAAAYPPPAAATTAAQKQSTVGAASKARSRSGKVVWARGVVRLNSVGPGVDLSGVVEPVVEVLEEKIVGGQMGQLERQASQRVIQTGFDEYIKVPPNDRQALEPDLQSQTSVNAQPTTPISSIVATLAVGEPLVESVIVSSPQEIPTLAETPAPSSKHTKNKSRSTPNLANLDSDLAAKVRDSLAEPLLPKGRPVVVDMESEFETDSDEGSWLSAAPSDDSETQKQQQYKREFSLQQERARQEAAGRLEQEQLVRQLLQQNECAQQAAAPTAIQRTHSANLPATNQSKQTKSTNQRSRQAQAVHHAKLEQAAKEAQRQRDMIKKVPTKSYQDLAQARANSVGLLSQLLNPNPNIFPPNHPYRRGYSQGNIGPTVQPMQPTTSEPGPSRPPAPKGGPAPKPPVAQTNPPPLPAAPLATVTANPSRDNTTIASALSKLNDPDPTASKPNAPSATQRSQHPRRHASTDDSRKYSSRSGLSSPIKAPPMPFMKSTAVMPVSSVVQAGSFAAKRGPVAPTTASGSNATMTRPGGYRPRGPPKDQEMDDSGSEAEGGTIQVPKSVAEQRLAQKRGIRQPPTPQPPPVPSKQVADDDVPEWARVSLPHKQHPPLTRRVPRGSHLSALAPQPPRTEPILLGHPYNLPPPAPPTTPRTTRRQMLSTELSESLRRNLLWERQITKNGIVKRTTSGGGGSHHSVLNGVQPFTGMPHVVKLHVKGTIPPRQLEDPSKPFPDALTADQERDEMRKHVMARNCGWVNDYSRYRR